MAGKQIAGDGLSMNLAGMSKNQLYDIMSQMKVNHSLSHFLSDFFFLNSIFFLILLFLRFTFEIFFSSKHHLISLKKFELQYNVFVFSSLLALQALIEQNQQQARQILIQNPPLTKALFQVSNF